MTLLKNNIILDTLMPSDTIRYFVSARLTAEYPTRFVLSMCRWEFDVQEYALAGNCVLSVSPALHAEVLHRWDGPETGIKKSVDNAWFDVTWEGHDLDVLVLHWENGSAAFVLADSEAIASRFVTAVSAWSAKGNDTVLVFENNHWQKDEELLKAISHATFENLILDPALKQEIQADLGRFFASKETYEAYRVPWKRGLLFVGPPGNGKTHTVKALVNEFKVACLYVKEMARLDSIHSVFEQARRSSPCILVLEDIDTLTKAEMRSALLNELDGFAANTGIVTLATTNHPEKLDAALLHRPSRFDRTYTFALPGLVERDAFLRRWNESLQASMRVRDEAIPHFVDQTGGFSFAYLKELTVSATMAWIELREHGAMTEHLSGQLAILQRQLGSNKGQAAMTPAAPAKDAKRSRAWDALVGRERHRKLEAKSARFAVTLADPGPMKISVIKTLRAFVPNIGLRDAKDLVDNVPSVIGEPVTLQEAEEMKTELEEAGATVSVVLAD